jgi:hypothetical protein
VLFFIVMGILGPHPSRGPVIILPDPPTPAADDDQRPKCECDEDECECAGHDGTECICPAAFPK